MLQYRCFMAYHGTRGLHSCAHTLPTHSLSPGEGRKPPMRSALVRHRQPGCPGLSLQGASGKCSHQHRPEPAGVPRVAAAAVKDQAWQDESVSHTLQQSFQDATSRDCPMYSTGTQKSTPHIPARHELTGSLAVEPARLSTDLLATRTAMIATIVIRIALLRACCFCILRAT